jgi:hypothetical protein
MEVPSRSSLKVSGLASRMICSGLGGIGPMEVKMVCGQKSNPPVPGYSGHILVASKYPRRIIANHRPSRLPRQ